MLSGYRIMWMVVMFDLPVTLKSERKAATTFRNALLDLGFEMVQFSVYMRFFSSDNKIQTYCRYVESAIPADGKVSILQLTDKQFERIINYQGKTKQKTDKKDLPQQLELF